MLLVVEILMLKLVYTENLMSFGHVIKGANSDVFENVVYTNIFDFWLEYKLLHTTSQCQSKSIKT
jgi:hypothetical protein